MLEERSLIAALVSAEGSPAKAISSDRIARDIEILASDGFAGPFPGMEGEGGP
ncbi:MAG: hypothetical protein R3282_06700 [Rhodothermales bacterium]|nr:hypothetical protein [Rhodothermales bacterium]